MDNTALNRFFGKIYGVVAMGIGLSAFVSFLAVTVFQPLLLSLISAGSLIMMLIIDWTTCFGRFRLATMGP